MAVIFSELLLEQLVENDDDIMPDCIIGSAFNANPCLDDMMVSEDSVISCFMN
jgi:hypothetical protein